jgi:hypothetical protein
MSRQTMSIHRALAELKTYDERIRRSMEMDFVIANKRSNDKIKGKTIDEVKKANCWRPGVLLRANRESTAH